MLETRLISNNCT